MWANYLDFWSLHYGHVDKDRHKLLTGHALPKNVSVYVCENTYPGKLGRRTLFLLYNESRENEGTFDLSLDEFGKEQNVHRDGDFCCKQTYKFFPNAGLRSSRAI